MMIFFNECRGTTQELVSNGKDLNSRKIAEKKIVALIAVPDSNLKTVECVGSAIKIAYASGEYDYFGDFNAAFPTLNTTIIHYDSEEIALKKMKDFYWAVSKNTGAFMF